MNPHLSIIIPAYNESSRITATLFDIHEYLQKQSYTAEVLVVVNNTTDNTVEVVEALQKEMPYLRVVDIGMHESGARTKGYAVRHGILHTTGAYKVFMDADNATKIHEIEKFWKHFENGANVVFGSRYIKGAHTHRVWYRDLLGRASNVLIQAVLLPGIWDTQCGFKAFTRDAAEDIFGRAAIDAWGFDMEVLAIARKRGHKAKEVPVRWKEIGKSSVKAGAFFETLKELFAIRKRVRKISK